LKNRYSFEIVGRPITLVPLKLKQIYDEQLKLKTEKMIKNESLYIKETFFANEVFPGFDDDVIFQLGTNLFSSCDDLQVIYSRKNPFEKGGDDMNLVKSEFCLKMSISFARSGISDELTFYNRILDI